jgi:type II secretory pathway component PulC
VSFRNYHVDKRLKSKTDSHTKHRDRKIKAGDISLTIWISKKDKKMLDRLKKQHNLSSYSSTISNLLQDVTTNKTVTINADLMISRKSVQTRYDLNQSLKTYKLILKLRKDGMIFEKISNYLNEHNIPTNTGEGKWGKGSVGRLVNHPPDYILQKI